MAPRLTFGAGGIGEGNISHTWTTPATVTELLSSLDTLGLRQLDSAASYPPGAPWVTETLLGEAKAAERGFVIDTKIEVTHGPEGRGSRHLSESHIDESVAKTLKLLGVQKVNILYSHGPDRATPFEETTRAFNKHYRAGTCEKLGVCSYSVTQMEKYLEVCEQNGYKKPDVYQGEYNAIGREGEKDLFPLLRKHGIKFYAFSPLAGGFLTGKFTFRDPKEDLSRGRWGEGNFPMYPEHFDKPIIHAAMKNFTEACKKHDLTSTEASLRWIMHHSLLGDEDAIILGATRVDQLKGNVDACSKGLLPDEVVAAADEMWKSVEAEFTKHP